MKRHALSRILLTMFCLAVFTAGLPSLISAQDSPVTFRIQSSPEVHTTPYSGRVYLFFTNADAEPRTQQNWFRPAPLLSMDVENWQPGTAIELSFPNPDVKYFPTDLKQEDFEGLSVQPVVRFSTWERRVGVGAGNGTGPVHTYRSGETPLLIVDRLIPEQPFPETDWTKLLTVRSEKMSQFYQQEVSFKAAVTLPASYFSNPDKRYPVILEIPGFGGRHDIRPFIHEEAPQEKNDRGVEFVRVGLDPSCPLGHHVFANSENNGPWGDAFVEEFLPELDRQYRTIAKPHARLLTGHSSGGWSSLWVQVNYPETFGGTWSTGPDPVAFNDFQYIDLYRDKNMFFDGEGNPRPLARMNGRVVLWYQHFSQWEDVIGHGEQLHSFEAVFSPRGSDGKPMRLWDRETGEIVPVVANAWKKYDIQLILENNWKELGPQLQGKIHIFMGTEDTFYLEGATERLKETLKQLGSDAYVEMMPGKDHMNLFQGDLPERIAQQMAESFLRGEEIAGKQN